MKFEKILFIDSAIATAGDGSTPAKALQNLPTDSVENCLYILRKYPETDTQKYYTLPCFNGWKGSISKFAFVGCPQTNEAFYDILSDDLKTALTDAGWLNSGNKYATIYCNTVNSMNVAINSGSSFYTENINYLRKDDTTLFDRSCDHNEARWMFYFSGNIDIISIKNCRWSAQECNIDDETYINPTPSQKCCGYLKANNTINKLIIENNIFNFIPYTVDNNNYAYSAFNFVGMIYGIYITKNKCYMTPSDNKTWVHSNHTSDNCSRYPREMFYFHYGNYNNAIEQQPRFVAFNYNDLVIRMCDYYNMNNWFYCEYFEKLEFIGNTITQGVPMKQYNTDELRFCLFKTDLVHIGRDDCRYSEYIIKDINIELPSIWGLYACSVLGFNMYNAGDDGNHQRYGLNRGAGKNIMQNITVILGEGPSIDDITDSDLSRINTWHDNGQALYIVGKQIWHGDCYYRYSNQANIAKNITVRYPWGKALHNQSLYTECKEIRGKIASGDASYVKIETMTIKKAKSNSIHILNTANGNIEINNLFIEDTSLNNYIGWNSRFNGRIIINKTNHSVTNSGSVFSSNTNDYYNEAMVVQKDIGDNHGFMLKSANKFIESCSVKHNNNTTLKMYGMYDHDRSLKLINCGESGLTKTHLLPGKYKLKLNMAFNGNDYYENSITTPSTNRRNILNKSNLTIGIKTMYGELSSPDDIVALTEESDNNYGWNTTEVTPFYHEYYVDIYEEQDVFTTIEKFNFYTTEGTTAAVYLDPEIEVIKIGDIA